MTEAEYLQAHTILTNEVENALESFFIYVSVENFASQNPLVLVQMNKNPEFWISVRHAQQTAFMVTLGRVFDTDKRSYSIHELLKETVKHPEYFSREAFARRRRGLASASDPEPSYLADYLKGVFEPDAAALEKLRTALKPISDKYEKNFAPIRNKIFAHRDKLDKAETTALVSKGLMGELEEIMHFVYDLLNCISQLIHNGVEPRLGVRTYITKRERKMRLRER